jgi:glucose-6-phosphate isomerase
MDRYLSDMKGIFTSADEIKDNPLIYSFNNIIPNNGREDLLYGETILYPGQINGEFFMTKGHKHIVESAEVYYCIEGKALVLCEKEDDSYEILLEPGIAAYCKPGYAHRVINNSNSICKFFCVCRADAGHDYNVTFKKKYFK